MSEKEKAFEVEIEASHTLRLVLEDGSFLTINPFALIEEMIEEKINYPTQPLEDISKLQKYLAYEMDDLY